MTEDSALATTDAMFRALVEQTRAGLYVIQDGFFRYVNPAFAEMSGYASPSDLIDLIPVSDLVAPADRVQAENLRRRLEGEIKDLRYSFSGLRRDGTVIAVEVHGGLFEHQAAPAVIGLVLDLTERKQIETAWRRKTKRTCCCCAWPAMAYICSPSSHLGTTFSVPLV